jgi:hypothetical protein
MDSATIDQVFDSLVAKGDLWTAALPVEIRFDNHPVELVIQTEPIPKPEIRAPNQAETALVRKVLGGLDTVLATSEDQLKTYLDEDMQYLNQINRAYVWINEEAIELDGPERWSFVIEFSTSESFGVHVVFDGLECLECWGAD